MLSKSHLSLAGTLAILGSNMILCPSANAAMNYCPDRDPIYAFANKTTSTRPTNLYSNYITGPGTITYTKTTTATATGTLTAGASAEAGVVVAKASANMSVSLSYAKSWSESFAYTLNVPAGQTKRMRLFQESRSFQVTKKDFNPGYCRYTTSYTSTGNLPRTYLTAIWRLE